MFTPLESGRRGFPRELTEARLRADRELLLRASQQGHQLEILAVRGHDGTWTDLHCAPACVPVAYVVWLELDERAATRGVELLVELAPGANYPLRAPVIIAARAGIVIDRAAITAATDGWTPSRSTMASLLQDVASAWTVQPALAPAPAAAAGRPATSPGARRRPARRRTASAPLPRVAAPPAAVA